MPRPGPNGPPAAPTIEQPHTAAVRHATLECSSAYSAPHAGGRHVGGEPVACWCCQLGDSYFDRLVKSAVLEHQRLLGQLADLHHSGAIAGSPDDCLAITGPSKHSYTASGACDGPAPKWTPDGTAPTHSLLVGDDSSSEAPPKEPLPRDLGLQVVLETRCTLNKTTMMDEKYFEECKIAHLAKSGSLPVAPASWVESHLAPMVYHKAFDIFFSLLIMVNSLTLGIGIQLSATSTADGSTERYLALLQQFFNVLFVVEWTLRVTVAGRSFFRAGPDFYWNWLDTATVLLIVVMEWTLAVVASSLDTLGFSAVRAVKALRLTRVMRVVRVSRLLSVIRALRYLVCSIANTLESLWWAVTLLFLICFIFASILTQAITDMLDDPDTSMDPKLLEDFEYWWGDLIRSMYTLFMCISGGVSWIEPAEPLWKVPTLLCCFLTYIIFAYFAVLNTVTGVFCERAIQSAHDDHYNMIQGLRDKRQDLNAMLERVFRRIDTTASGFVTLLEFEQIVEDEEIRLLFESMEINLDDARDLFKHLDADEGGQLELHELISGAMRIRGGAKGLDMIRLQHDMTKVKRQIRAIAQSIDHLFYREATHGTGGDPK